MRIRIRSAGHEIGWHIPSLVARHGIGDKPAQIALQCISNQIQSCQPLHQLRRIPRHIGVFIHRQGARVAGCVIGQNMHFGLQLEDVKKVAPKAIEARIARFNAGYRREDCGSPKAIFD